MLFKADSQNLRPNVYFDKYHLNKKFKKIISFI